MTNEQLIVKFNPANGSNVAAEDLAILRELTDEQIDILANAYPNVPVRKSYLRLYDKNIKPEKQLYQLSTWQNLRNVRKFSNMKNLIAWDFLVSAGKAPVNVKSVGRLSPSMGKKVVVDLTAQEAADELTKAITESNKIKTATIDTRAKPAEKTGKKSAPKVTKVSEGKPETGNVPADQDFD